MTKLSRRCTWIIVLSVFLLAAFIFVSWGSEGFRQWDTSKWFNYWWQGKSAKVVKVEEQPIEQRAMALTSAQSSSHDLTYDSDDVSLTADVKYGLALDLEIAPDGLYVTGTSTDAQSWGTKITVEVRQKNASGLGIGTLLGSFEKTITASTRVGETLHYLIPYNEFSFYIADLTTGTEFSIRVINLAHGDYLAKTGHAFYFAKPEGTFNPTLSGTDIFVPYGAIPKSDFHLNHVFNPLTGSFPSSAISVGNDGVTIHLAEIPFLERGIENVVLTLTAHKSGTGSTPSYFGFCYEFQLHITKLAAPKNIKYENCILSWDPVPGAMGYAVFDGDKLYSDTLIEPSLNLDGLDFSAGEHTFRVRALGNVGRAIADSASTTMQLTAYNSSFSITQLVALTMSVGDDNIVKLVPYGMNILDYCYEVKVPGKEFGGWYYDDGYSRKVETSDVLNGDTTIYARLSDKKVVERAPTWWEQYMWYVLGPAIVVAALGIIVGVVVGIRKKKAVA